MTEIMDRINKYITLSASTPKVQPSVLTDERALNGFRKFVELTLGLRMANRYTSYLLTVNDPAVLREHKMTRSEIKKVFKAAIDADKDKKYWVGRMLKLSKTDPVIGAYEFLGVAVAMARHGVKFPGPWREPLTAALVVLQGQAENAKIDKDKTELFNLVKATAKELAITLPKVKVVPDEPISDAKKALADKASNQAKEMAKVKRVLKQWVKDYITARYNRNSSIARDIKKSIDSTIAKFKLNAKEVYFQFGDPDDPEQRAAVRKAIGMKPEPKPVTKRKK